MDITDLLTVLSRINGCTFASLDAVTEPSKGIRKVTKGQSVLLFTNKEGSGYERMVKRRLEAAGKDPTSFAVSDLPFGMRMPGTPVITHYGKYYLQVVVLSPGSSEYFMGKAKVNPDNLGLPAHRTNQGLPRGDEVVVNTYRLDHITELRLLGDKIEPSLASLP